MTSFLSKVIFGESVPCNEIFYLDTLSTTEEIFRQLLNNALSERYFGFLKKKAKTDKISLKIRINYEFDFYYDDYVLETYKGDFEYFQQNCFSQKHAGCFVFDKEENGYHLRLENPLFKICPAHGTECYENFLKRWIYILDKIKQGKYVITDDDKHPDDECHLHEMMRDENFDLNVIEEKIQTKVAENRNLILNHLPLDDLVDIVATF